MKKLFAVFAAVAFALSMAAVAVAQEKKAAPAPAPAKAEPAKKDVGEKKEAVKKPKARVVTGTIEALDAGAGTLTVKGKKGPVSLKAGEKVKLDTFKMGDKVTVTYKDDTATKVVAAKKAAAKKAAAPPAAEPKKAAAPAAEPKKEGAMKEMKETLPPPTKK